MLIFLNFYKFDWKYYFFNFWGLNEPYHNTVLHKNNSSHNGMPNYIEVFGSNFSKTSKYEFALAIFTILT